LFAFAACLLLATAATPPSADEFYKNGLAKLRQRQFLAAIGNFTEAVSLKPDYADAYLQRAKAKELLAQQQGYTDNERYADLLQATRLGQAEALATISQGYDGGCVTGLEAEPQADEVFCLDISNTNLKTIPAQVSRYADVVRLDVSRNRLTDLNGIFEDNQAIVFLDAHENRISNLPANIKNLSFLRELNLRDNDLKTIPTEMAQLKNLQTLNLSGNPISVAERDRIRQMLPDCNVYFNSSETVAEVRRSPKFRSNRKTTDSQAHGKAPKRF